MNTQKGSAHLIGIMILAVALLGALGFIFWQNFVGKEKISTSNQTTKPEQKSRDTSKDDPIEVLTYGDDTLTFDYPTGWSVKKETSEGFTVWTIGDDASDSKVTIGMYGDSSELSYAQKVEQLRNTQGVSNLIETKVSNRNAVNFIDDRDESYHYSARIFSEGGSYSVSAPNTEDSKNAFDLLMKTLVLKS